ncbi:MAG: IPT/TIG domain-containing protein [Armatimonadota bacterium]
MKNRVFLQFTALLILSSLLFSIGGCGIGAESLSAPKPAYAPVDSGAVLECRVVVPDAGAKGLAPVPSGFSPLIGARVSAAGYNKYTTTDSTGYAKLEGLVDGNYNIIIGKDGYQVLTYSIDVDSASTQTVGSSSGISVQTSTSPGIMDLSCAQGPGGATVIITGINFGASQGSTSFVTFGGVQSTVISWSDTRIKCMVPQGAPSGNIYVYVGSQQSNGVEFTVIADGASGYPAITGINPVSGAIGTSVTITGTNFGNYNPSNTINFNGTEAETVSGWTNNQIICNVPSGATTGNIVIMTNGKASNGYNFIVGSGGSGDYDLSRIYYLNGFSGTDAGVLAVCSQQTSYDAVFYYSASLGNAVPTSREISITRNLDEFKLLPKSPIPRNIEESKDIHPYWKKYAEYIHKTEGVDKSKKLIPKAYSEGDQETFTVFQWGVTPVSCTAQCYKVGENCYVFIDVDSTDITAGNRSTVATNIATAFDSNNDPFNTGVGIYGNTREYFGTEWKPGIDGDNRVFLLLSPKLGIGLYGYFYTLDETTGQYSNQKEIVYIHDHLFANNMYTGLSTVSHEFQHMIDYYMKYKVGGEYELTTINEGKSMLSEYLNGFGYDQGDSFVGNNFMVRKVRDFFNLPSSFQFEEWGGGLYYGAAFGFMLYIYERFGADGLKAVAKSFQTGRANITQFTGTDFSIIYRDWVLVNYYSGLNGSPRLPSGNSSAKYDSLNPKATYTVYTTWGDNSATTTYTMTGVAFSSTVSTYTSSDTPSLGQYACKYIKFTPQTGYSGLLSILYQSNAAYSTYSNFVLERPSGTYYSTQ